MSADVDADLDRELNRVLRGQAAFEAAFVCFAAPLPDALELREQLPKALEPRLDAFRVDRSGPP